MKGWKYKGRYLREIPEGYFGFIYIITNKLTGCFYIGKKYFELSNRKKLTKKEKLLPENKRKRYKTVKSDSKWLHYWGSSLPLLADIKEYGEENFDRKILHLCKDKTELTYMEVKEQFKHNVLECNSYNGNILSRFFKQKQ